MKQEHTTFDTSIYPLTLLYDGACPMCSLEMHNLMVRNHEGLLKFIDISQPGFDPAPYGRSLEEMCALLHAQRADGQIEAGVPVFDLAYRAVGLGYLTAPTMWPVLRPVADYAYKLLADNRLQVSQTALPLINRIATRRAAVQAQRNSAACHNGQCDLASNTAAQKASAKH